MGFLNTFSLLASVCLLSHVSCQDRSFSCYNGHCDGDSEYCDSGAEMCLTCSNLCRPGSYGQLRPSNTASDCEKLCPYYLDKLRRKDLEVEIKRRIEALQQTQNASKCSVPEETSNSQNKAIIPAILGVLLAVSVLANILLACYLFQFCRKSAASKAAVSVENSPFLEKNKKSITTERKKEGKVSKRNSTATVHTFKDHLNPRSIPSFSVLIDQSKTKSIHQPEHSTQANDSGVGCPSSVTGSRQRVGQQPFQRSDAFEQIIPQATEGLQHASSLLELSNSTNQTAKINRGCQLSGTGRFKPSSSRSAQPAGTSANNVPEYTGPANAAFAQSSEFPSNH